LLLLPNLRPSAREYAPVRPMEFVSTVALDRIAAAEATLVARLAAGDRREPLAALYDRYGARVYGLGVHLLGDRGLAEDLVQETFVRLWRSAERFDPARASVRTFVFTLARRAAVDLLRRRTSRPATTELPDEHPALASDEAFDELLTGIDVRAVLDALSPKHREILELHVLGDLTQADVAERLRVPLGTVKTRTFYALRALKSELEERDLLG
jgi:RNA polymerase sigma-70 factor (ECF subfamily)